jgi:ATP-dependent DNA helicase RecG
MDLRTNVLDIPGVGESYAHKLEKLGINSIEDLLLYLPRRWDDYSNILPITQIQPGETVCVHGEVWQINNKKSKRGLNITEAIVNDKTGTIKAVWFNQPFLTKNIKVGDQLFLAGKVEWTMQSFSMVSPSYEVTKTEGETESSDLTHVGRIVPVYPETEGISSKWLRSKIKPLMKYIYSIKDFLPNEIKDENQLVDYPAAIRQMHFPENNVQLKRAMDRFDFDEMFLLQLAVLNSRKSLQKEKSIAIPFAEKEIQDFVQSLPFDLTKAQRKASWEIIQDMAKKEPMNRLLQGDVGSGKTMVAAMAIVNAAANDTQSVLLCPTEVLAKQHYKKLVRLLDSQKIEVAILTGSTPKQERTELLSRIHDGDVKVVVGTHALLEKDVEFWRLGVAIVDEQHRFGVEQRAALRKESKASGTVPHFLSMTATPIPRTLTLTLYGDLDVSILNEMPKGRQRIITKLVPKEKREVSYQLIAGELKKGRQAFVVCPLIGEETTGDEEELQKELEISAFAELEKKVDDDLERKTVLNEYQNLKKVFPEFRIEFLHGKLRPAEKEQLMTDFAAGEIHILVSTSVIEVGIDVPNATIMLIEDADRFGLAQLHQFRGRVGRGEHLSYCFLFSNSRNPETAKRLLAITETTDGFKLAEADLELRGPGEFIGKKQHGLPDVKMKNLLNTVLIKKCRDAAIKFLMKHEIDEYPMLTEKLKKYDSVLHLE